MMTFNAVLLLVAVVTAQPPAPSIDAILAAAWKRHDIEPAEIVNDDQFLRRVTLDLAGRIPTLDEIRRFRAAPDRRAKIDELLAGNEFPRFWSEVWAAALNGYTDAFESDREVLRAWLEESFRDDVPYDRLVTQLLTSQGTAALDGPVNFLIRYPEEPAVKVTRMFVGVRLDCARCHDHPFDRWTQEDFALMNRFFAATRRQEVSEGNVRLVNALGEAGEEDRPRFLTGARPRTSQWRDELALFMTSSKPFGRAYANRVWYHFMGRGIVEPVDDFNRENPAAVPELIEYLAEQARGDEFAVRPMIRRICNSRAYQLASRHDERSPQAESLFAYHLLKPLTPEQTFDSVALALNIEQDGRRRRESLARIVGESLDEDFSHTWQYRETVQTLMSRLNVNPTAPAQSPRELYLRILSREPNARELEICREQRPADVAFALLNSNEFFFNH